MKETKPKSIENIGLAIIVLSGIIIVSNLGGAIASKIVGFGGEKTAETNFVFDHYLEMCLTMVSIGLASLFAGIYLRKYKLWASKLISLTCCVMIVMFWIISLSSISTIIKENGPMIILIFCVVFGVIVSIPLIILIRFLNLKRIKQHLS
ncbi:MAG: hypothetical protein EOO68_23615 [Moraxellaceae bacterium]|nr:MAG: hypothetical protein EOO68_23615 [Moraxellaceae bacterium]